jgi:hypothetical protein
VELGEEKIEVPEGMLKDRRNGALLKPVVQPSETTQEHFPQIFERAEDPFFHVVALPFRDPKQVAHCVFGLAPEERNGGSRLVRRG